MAERHGGEPPRQPRNLQGLLNFCTEITAREDTTTTTAYAEMDPERRAFLEEALAGMTVDVVKQMAEAVKVLYEDAVMLPEEEVTEQEDAIDLLSEHVEDLNYAADLQKLGGFPSLVRCLVSPHVSLRIGAANLIGEVCQNNTYCQENMLALNPLPALLQMLDSDDSHQARIKALFALSCMVRGHAEAEARFLEFDGLSYLMRAMQSGVEKLVVKAAFFLNNLVLEHDACKDTVLSMGYVEQLASILSNESIDEVSREHCTMVLSSLATSYPPALNECLRPELNLLGLLRNRLSTIKGILEHEDEEHYITDLLKLVEDDGDDDSNCR
ncbi:Hsp70-binding protein 1 [Halocaridina rubra]|uniref:Hsp70-binding protein 1 n=1 Tax=Halocaridina rubra TaxID=373956 RepID=A0AAN8X6E2_HALRR